jgi:hypothetical protein
MSRMTAPAEADIPAASRPALDAAAQELGFVPNMYHALPATPNALLNRWFTVLQVPDEGPLDEADFVTLYEQVVPADIRERNARILGGSF